MVYLINFVIRWGNKVVMAIKNKINDTVEELLFQALQIDNDSVCAQIKAERLGVL